MSILLPQCGQVAGWSVARKISRGSILRLLCSEHLSKPGTAITLEVILGEVRALVNELQFNEKGCLRVKGTM